MEKYTNAITYNIKNVQNVEPLHHGKLTDNILLATTSRKKLVCKFDDLNSCRHDVFVSKILNANGINVPKTKIKKHEDLCFTVYEYQPGRTLYDLINNGMPANEIGKIYGEAFNTVYKMSQIPVNPKRWGRNMFASDKEFLFYKILDTKMGFFHNDLHAGNILVSDDGHVAGLLDTNAITLSTSNMFLARTWIKYPYEDFAYLLKYWAKISGQKMDAERADKIFTLTQTMARVNPNEKAR